MGVDEAGQRSRGGRSRWTRTLRATEAQLIACSLAQQQIRAAKLRHVIDAHWDLSSHWTIYTVYPWLVKHFRRWHHFHQSGSKQNITGSVRNANGLQTHQLVPADETGLGHNHEQVPFRYSWRTSLPGPHVVICSIAAKSNPNLTRKGYLNIFSILLSPEPWFSSNGRP